MGGGQEAHEAAVVERGDEMDAVDAAQDLGRQCLDVRVGVDRVHDAHVAVALDQGTHASKASRNGGPKLSRRWAVSTTRRPSSSGTPASGVPAGSNGRAATSTNASTTVLPVTTMSAPSMPSASRLTAGRGGRGEVQVGDHADHAAVDLLRERVPPVVGAQARLHVGDAHTRWNAPRPTAIAVVVSPWTRTQSGSALARSSSIPPRTRAATWDGVWPTVMTSRSWSGRIPKSSSTSSSISRCWPVTATEQSMPGREPSSATTGAILMASGRVPNTQSTRVNDPANGPPASAGTWQRTVAPAAGTASWTRPRSGCAAPAAPRRSAGRRPAAAR